MSNETNKPVDYVYDAKVVRVIDGDTIDVLIRWDIGFGVKCETLQRLRLSMIDAPEVRGEEREEGLKAKAALVQLFNDHEEMILVKTSKDDAFGRYIAEVYVYPRGGEEEDQINVNYWLVDNGYATLFE